MVWLWFLFLQPLLLCCVTALASPFDKQKPGCPATCGNVAVPYPFGIGSSDCFKDQGFEIYCNETFDPPKAFLGKGSKLEVMEIKQEQVRIRNWVSYKCSDSDRINWQINLRKKPFTLSHAENKLTVIGCDTEGYVVNDNYLSGCKSACGTEPVIDGTCSGNGCSQARIPEALKLFTIRVVSNSTTSNPCSYAFVVDKTSYKFSKSDLSDPNFIEGGKKLPMVLDWAIIGDKTCEEAKNSNDYACGKNSDCFNFTNGPGYICNCAQGYQGNPYLEDGCEDIDECLIDHPCETKESCNNWAGGYSCSCPDGMLGDGKSKERGGSGCTAGAISNEKSANSNAFLLIKAISGTGVGLLFLLVGSSWLYWGFKKRKLLKLKEKFFHQNGGLLLQQKISLHEGVDQVLKIFTTKELEIATNNYDESRILGRGGYGIVYKGFLPNDRIVAIKKSKIVDGSQIEQFVNEVVILSQINHRNVVKLLGCCLETQVPLLVYEFVSNETLFYHIHDESHASSISWENRLRIASETAGALAYLHSSTSTPVIHRDVKSANILLDDNFTAKVSDFGASRLVPMDHGQVTTLVQGTFGYLDPEYFHTSQLTEKSDVYSFGVVLLELLTGMLPVSFERSQGEINLAAYFIASMKENLLFKVLEARVMDEGSKEQLQAVAYLAHRCLRVKGEERPTMKEVAMELEGLRRFQEHPWVQHNPQETEYLLGEASQHYIGGATGHDSLENHIILDLDSGR